MCLAITRHILIGQLGSQGKKEADSTCRFNVLQDGYKSQADFSGKCGADPLLAPVQILSKPLIWTVAGSHTTTRPCPLPICNDNQTVSDTQFSFVQKELLKVLPSPAP
jgi:hypothetical protein